MTNAKVIFTLVETVETIRKACVINSSSSKIFAIKENHQQTIPDGVIDFAELMDPVGKQN